MRNPKDIKIGEFTLEEILERHLQYLQDSDEKGLIWVNGANNELKVNLSQKYEWKLDVAMVNGAEGKLTYAIDNAEKNVTFNFKYNSQIKLDDGSTI